MREYFTQNKRNMIIILKRNHTRRKRRLIRIVTTEIKAQEISMTNMWTIEGLPVDYRDAKRIINYNYRFGEGKEKTYHRERKNNGNNKMNKNDSCCTKWSKSATPTKSNKISRKNRILSQLKCINTIHNGTSSKKRTCDCSSLLIIKL